MRKIFALLICSVAVSGCGVSVPVQMASMVLDGVSMMTTEKTLADHGLSALAGGKDCSMVLALEDGKLCQEDGKAAKTMAKADTKTEQKAPVEAAAAPETPKKIAAAATETSTWAPMSRAETSRPLIQPMHLVVK